VIYRWRLETARAVQHSEEQECHVAEAAIFRAEVAQTCQVAAAALQEAEDRVGALEGELRGEAHATATLKEEVMDRKS
jgi:hypothetical protein